MPGADLRGAVEEVGSLGSGSMRGQGRAGRLSFVLGRKQSWWLGADTQKTAGSAVCVSAWYRTGA